LPSSFAFVYKGSDSLCRLLVFKR